MMTNSESSGVYAGQLHDRDESKVIQGQFDKVLAGLAGLRKSVDFSISILNGIIGDFLAERGNDLAIPMQLFQGDRAVDVRKLFFHSDLTRFRSKMCVLVHGLTTNESIWNFKNPAGTSYGTLIEKDLGYSPFMVRYNSGLHISQNGQLLSDLLDEFVAAFPIPVKEIMIIAHSMGGLVIRSATHYGSKRAAPWLKKVSRIFYLGTPHEGAPMEKAGNALTSFLTWIPRIYIRKLGEIGNIRSSGIKDLRYSYLVDEDWRGRNQDRLLENNKHDVPLLEGPSHYFISGSLHARPDHPLNFILGDGMVRQSSVEIPPSFRKTSEPDPKIQQRKFWGTGHIKLARSAEVYEYIKQCCERTPVKEKNT